MAMIILALIGVLFIGWGIYCWNAREAVGFWANSKKPPMTNEKQYNHKVGNLWMMYGGSLILLSIPLKAGQNSGWVVITLLGIVFMTLMIMVLYTEIERIYRKDK